MYKWSEYFQNPHFLEMSRMMILNRDAAGYVSGKIGLRPGMKALDVGCGTGAFTFYLADTTDGVEYSGLDNDDVFIAEANRLKESRKDGNRYSFTTGDALHLPYEDDSFDCVFSHTFLTSIPDYVGAIREMKRVVRPGGVVASMTAMTLYNQTVFPGIWPAERYPWYIRFSELNAKVQNLYQQLVPLKDYASGIQPAAVPYVMSLLGLRQVSAYPVGKFFSLSNAAMKREDKRRFLELEELSEEERLEAVRHLPGAGQYLTDEEAEEYIAIRKERRDALIRDMDGNLTWEWMGDASLLVCGVKE